MSGPHVSRPEHGIDDIQAGQEALARGAWGEARACFEAALRRAETPEALEGLGMAAWWLTDAATYFPVREQAYRLYRERNDRRGAARTAICLALDAFLFQGEYAICNGWFRRAHRLLDGLEPGAEQVLLAIWEGYAALAVQHDAVCAHRLSDQALAIARSLGLLDLEMLAQALLGLALVSAGDVARGMPLLDEATAVATAGEMTDLDAIVTTCCFLIAACEQVRDYDRAAQWCAKAMQIAARWSYRFISSFCRTHYAGVLIRRGAWGEAEAALVAATDDLALTHPAMAAEGLVRLAELRRCQGRLAEAAALLERLGEGPLRMLGGELVLLERAALALEQDDAVRAAELAERALRAVPVENRLERVDGLELLVQAQAALGDHAQATETLRQLQMSTTDTASLPLQAAVQRAAGMVAVATGDHQTARRHLEEAVDLFDQSGSSYEAARARLVLARVLAELGRSTSAEQEVRLALDVSRRIGASPLVVQAEALLRNLRPPGGSGDGATGDQPALTPRELEVLRLVAQGQSDREIAATLNLSAHTVHRHVSNILTKLGLPSRAAAVAEAARHGLL